MAGAPAKILVVAPASEVECRALPSLLHVLKRRFPSAQRDILAQDSRVPQLMEMPLVDRAISLPFAAERWDIGGRYRFGVALQQEAYDWAIVLPLSFRDALIPFFAEIPLRTGWRGEMRYFLLNDIRLLIRRHYPVLYQQFAALGFDFDVEVPQASDLPAPEDC